MNKPWKDPRTDGGSMRRFMMRPIGAPTVLARGSRPDVDATTRYRARVLDPAEVAQVFKDGHNNAKIGRRVTKGRLKGMPIYTLTLEERATCPQTCAHWLSCYGNKMQWPFRHAHGEALEAAVERGVRLLSAKHPGGYLIRLHVLGDFYSVAYVRLWARLLDEHAALHVYGYTHRKPDSAIGALLDELSAHYWERFALRFSNAGMSERGANTLWAGAGKDGIVCPAQQRKDVCCASCGLCWNTRRNIAFLHH